MIILVKTYEHVWCDGKYQGIEPFYEEWYWIPGKVFPERR